MTRKAWLALLVMFLFSSCSDDKRIEISKVEHFYVSSTHAKDLFNLFNSQFALPAVWDYQSWGSFSSGGITLGNVVFEFVESRSEQTPTHYGIALEPSQSLKRTSSFLDSVKIVHGNISKAKEWSTMSLNNLLPDNINLFLCDYHDREFIKQDRKKAIDQLVINNGGTLGIQLLKEIVIGAQETGKFGTELAKIPGLVRIGNDFLFCQGPNLKLTESDTPFLDLIINVKSLYKAKIALETLGIKTRITQQGLEIVDQIFTPNITLIE